MVTGTTHSKLSDLRKYKITNIFNQQYWGNGSFNNDGVVFNQSNPNIKIIYYIGGIKYIDDIVNGTTIFSFIPTGVNSPDFISERIYKDPNKSKLVDSPKIDDDVFIDRQEVSVFEKNYKLEHVGNLSELITYASGRYFNILNNS